MNRYVAAIRRSGLTIYDSISLGDPKLWIPTPELQVLLDDGLRRFSLAGLPLRTRSKLVKERVCQTLGYPVPGRFRRTRPRFPGQNLDTYAQKSDNLQVWNDEIAPERRYALIRISAADVITHVRVVTGSTLAQLNTTGTLTRKFQARCIPKSPPGELIAATDTERVSPLVSDTAELTTRSPVDRPEAGEILSISAVYDRLQSLIGERFADAGHDQERNRGSTLHRLVCARLGYGSYRDDGQFPDILHQLIEVKLQMSPTIDLGLVAPTSTETLELPAMRRQQIRHCDVRYAVFYGRTDGGQVTLTHLFLTTGAKFFSRFPQFQGMIVNRKLQIRLPSDFFSDQPKR